MILQLVKLPEGQIQETRLNVRIYFITDAIVLTADTIRLPTEKNKECNFNFIKNGCIVDTLVL